MMTPREYCESQGFKGYRVAGGMFDLRRDGTPSVHRAHLGRALDNEEGWAWAEAAVRAYVEAESVVQAGQQDEADDLLAAAPGMDGRMDEPPLTEGAIMGEAAETDTAPDEDAPADAQEPDAQPEPEPDDPTDTQASPTSHRRSSRKT